MTTDMAAALSGNRNQEYLSFFISGQEFAVDILSVQEIRVWSSATEIPNTPGYLKGVINLRGVIIPIVDLRERFGAAPVDYDATTVVIILHAELGGKKSVVGIVVDSVSEVHNVSEEQIRQAPDFGQFIDSRFLKGMATVDDKIITLLETNSLLDADVLYAISSQTRAV